MSCALFLTDVDHCRVGPQVHQFRYKSLSFLVDLERLEELNQQAGLVKYNCRGLFSIWDKDYLPSSSSDVDSTPSHSLNIRDRLLEQLRRKGIQEIWSRVELLTSPRFIGYVFNPVNFYLCYQPSSGVPSLCVAEVNNTFGETHLYITEPDLSAKSNEFVRFRARKEFHVSPFFDRQGDYEFFVKRQNDLVDVRINLKRDGETIFTSRIAGRTREGTDMNSVAIRLRTALWGARYGWLTFPRIVWQAALLKFHKGLRVFTRPAPSSEWTIGRRKPTVIQRVALAALCDHLKKLKTGRLLVRLPTGQELHFGKIEGEASAVMQVEDWTFFSRVLLGGDVAFGECYCDGTWTTSDLCSVLKVFAENVEHFNDRDILVSKLLQIRNRFSHLKRANSRAGSKSNISAHYNLGNELFREFLDGRMIYSCAVFENESDSLELAQLHKLNRIIQMAKIESHHHVLEIGSGWGALAIEIARQTGCRVTTITLSEEQLNYAKEQIHAAGLSERIEIQLCDYRDVKGKFDRIVSVEMLEAVGRENLGTFVRRCEELLGPHGAVVIQSITVPDEKYEEYSRGCDWIQRYIFPGGHCPSLAAITSTLKDHTDLVFENVERIGPHYARTLREWRRRFFENEDSLIAKGYDERFQRMWEYYLTYCEVGFDTKLLDTVQLTLVRR